MIYKGKEYKYIKRKDAEKGDLVHITEVNGTKCDDYRFIHRIDGDFIFDIRLSSGWCFVSRSDTFKTYRYVKDVKVDEVVESISEVLSHDNTKEGEYFVIISNTSAHEFEIDEVVKKGEIISSSSFSVSSVIDRETWCVGFDEVRRVTDAEVAEAYSIKKELLQAFKSNPTTLDKATRDKLNEVAKGGSMHIIYEGKEYKKVTDGSGEIGDLIHATEIDRESCDIWCFTTNSIANLPAVDVRLPLPNGYKVLDIYTDKFKRYRYVKDVKETSTEKSTVFAVVEYSFSHQGLVNKKEVDRHVTLDRAIAVSEGLNNRNRKCFYSVDGILV